MTATVDELRARVTEKGPWFPVKAGTPEADCARCDADELYWIVTDAGKRMLVDCSPRILAGAFPPHRDGTLGSYEALDGRGVSHFATCPAADKFRSRRP
jgi:hypothetical protein